MRKRLLILLFLLIPAVAFGWGVALMGIPSSDSDSTFRFEVKTAGADTFKLPIYNGGTYNFTVVWGDGGSDTITAFDDAAANHSYAGAGTYNVEITGVITGWRFNNAGDKTLIYDISEFGPLDLGNLNGYFFGCTNLTISATDELDLTGTTNMESMFRFCSSLTTAPTMLLWDTSAVTNMTYMFSGCTNFNQSVSNFNTALVTNIRYMFSDCTNFNQSVSNFNTALVTNMIAMFNGCVPFNQSVSNFNTVLVTNMSAMFQGCTNFNQSVANFNIAKVVTMTNMFYLANALSTANYDALLIAWEAQVEKPNVVFHAGDAVMTLGGAAEAARNALVANGWTITDSTGEHT